jgi:predicted transcriptional regulator
MMEHRLEHEEQLAPPPSMVEMTSSQLDDIAAEQQLDPEIRALIARCLDGTEDYGRELKSYEPAKFSPINVATILLMSAGFRQVEAAEILGLQQTRVSVIAHHPYGRKLLSALMTKQSGRVLDIKTRLEQYAGELLDKIHLEAKASNNLGLVSKITFDMLDRAGFNPTQKIEARTTSTEVTVTDNALNRLSNALEESRRVDSAIMPHMKASVPPAVGGEVIGASQQADAGDESGFAPSTPGSSPSPLKRLAEAND